MVKPKKDKKVRRTWLDAQLWSLLTWSVMYCTDLCWLDLTQPDLFTMGVETVCCSHDRDQNVNYPRHNPHSLPHALICFVSQCWGLLRICLLERYRPTCSCKTTAQLKPKQVQQTCISVIIDLFFLFIYSFTYLFIQLFIYLFILTIFLFRS